MKLLFILLLASLQLSAQSFLKTDGKKIVNEKGENILLRGIGLGGWMLQEGYMLKVHGEGMQHRIRQRIEDIIGQDKTQEFYTAWLQNHTTKADVDSLKAWGFNSIRLPMHYNLYTLPIEKEPVAGQQTWLETGFQLTDSLLEWCKANKMYLILDLHAAPGGQGNDLNISDRDPSKPSLWESEANQQKTIALWRKLAERYKDEPWIGGYDIINEPNWGFTDASDKNGLKETGNAPLRKLMVDITNAIREVDQRHIVIIEGNGWGNNYNGIFPLWDDNMVLSFHKYWNTNDPASIKHIIDAREKYNVPAWLGETGENSNTWFRDAVHLLESNNIGWAWWPLKKLGHNNPFQVKTNAGYEAILQYWGNKGPKPNAEEAYQSLMQLASSTRNQNNIVHYDVIDALIRQPFSNETKPYTQHQLNNDVTINAVDYDLGRNGFAYYDMDTANYSTSGKPGEGNRGHMYRNDGVDINEKDGRYYVDHIEANEWLQYTIMVNRPGDYNLSLLFSSTNPNGSVTVMHNNKKAISQKIGSTGGQGKFVEKNLGKMHFNKGTQKIKILFHNDGISLQSLHLKK